MQVTGRVKYDACPCSNDFTKRSPFLSSIGKQKFMRFRIVRESIGYGGGFMSITLEIFVLYLFCNLLNDPFWVIVMFPENILKDLVPS